jgi:alcohol dehydrogenase YqhD (iron-dependent ADH family)
MEKFVYYNPTKLHFGKGVIEKLGKVVDAYGKKVLFIFGGGSIIKNGVYRQVMDQLNNIGAEVYEYPGIRPNPILEDVDAAARLGREKNVDLVLAVGGGSVIDSAKVISVTIPVQHTAWKFYDDSEKPEVAIPLIAVLTLAATGTEMNPFAVVQNNETKEKLGWSNDLMYPRHSFLDPKYTCSVPSNYTSYGIADLMAHCFEAYFGEGDASLSDKVVFSILREAIEYGPPLLKNLSDYDLRSRIMYAATLALNKLTMNGRKNGDWGVHQVGHVLSLLYDVPHGASLSIVFPAWMKYHRKKLSERLAWLGQNVFGVKTAGETIKSFESFFRRINCPVRLSEMNIPDVNNNEILRVLELNEASGNVHKLTPEDYPELLQLFE